MRSFIHIKRRTGVNLFNIRHISTLSLFKMMMIHSGPEITMYQRLRSETCAANIPH